ncbi:hypothetical protein LCGC14_2440550 [marine sediment metagenome]|uniref:HNH nuclease domain-containing protein n=1 Tax=marine sediment metagenome TaxID=412755 RepID=A0A0F9ED31_9ZZZZ
MNRKGKNNSNYGHKWTDEQKKKHSILTKKAMNNPEVREKLRKNHINVFGENNPMFDVHRFGKKAANYKDGRSLKKYYCKECGKKVRWQTALGGEGRCRKCANRAQVKNFPGKCIDCGKQLKSYKSKKCRSCALKNYIKYNPRPNGEAHPNYIKDLIRVYPFEFNNRLKEKIRKRDNYQCQKCNITEEEHLIVYGIKLGVHHIDYDKMNCKEENLITLCRECNLRANYNRDYWKEYFKKRVLVNG